MALTNKRSSITYTRPIRRERGRRQFKERRAGICFVYNRYRRSVVVCRCVSSPQSIIVSYIYPGLGDTFHSFIPTWIIGTEAVCKPSQQVSLDVWSRSIWFIHKKKKKCVYISVVAIAAACIVFIYRCHGPLDWTFVHYILSYHLSQLLVQWTRVFYIQILCRTATNLPNPPPPPTNETKVPSGELISSKNNNNNIGNKIITLLLINCNSHR